MSEEPETFDAVLETVKKHLLKRDERVYRAAIQDAAAEIDRYQGPFPAKRGDRIRCQLAFEEIRHRVLKLQPKGRNNDLMKIGE